jgi:hypothetical protein
MVKMAAIVEPPKSINFYITNINNFKAHPNDSPGTLQYKELRRDLNLQLDIERHHR